MKALLEYNAPTIAACILLVIFEYLGHNRVKLDLGNQSGLHGSRSIMIFESVSVIF